MADVGDPLVAAIVDDAPLMTSALDAATRRTYDAALATPRATPIDLPWVEDIRTRRLEDLIDDLLLTQHLRIDPPKLPPPAIDAALAAEVTTLYAGDRAAFLASLARQGLTEADARQRIQATLTLEASLRRIGRIDPDDRDLIAAYTRAPHAFLIPARATLTLLSIPLHPRADAASLRDALALAQTSADLLRASADPLSASLDPRVERLSLSRYPIERLSPPMRHPVATASAPAIIGPIRTARGFEVAFVSTLNPALDPSAASPDLSDPDLNAALTALARRDLVALRRRQLLDTLRKEATILRFDSAWHRRLQRRLRFETIGSL
jgi:hypothetical protein